MATRTPPPGGSGLDGPTEHLFATAPHVPAPRAPEAPRPRKRSAIAWAGIPAAAAVLVGAIAAVAQILDYVNGKTVLLVVATGLVLVVAPIAPLARRGDRAVPASVAVLLCLLIAVGGIVTGYGLRGGFVPGTPWAPGLTGDTGPRIPGATPAPTTQAAAPPATEATGATPLSLTDPDRSDTVVDHNSYLGVSTGPMTVAGRPLTDAFRTFCSCSRTPVEEGTLVVALGGGYRTVSAVLGVDQASQDAGQVQVTVRDVATGRVLLARTVGFAAAVPVTVDVTGVQRLEFAVRGPLGGVTGVIGEPRAQP